jgi:hypothetical protein
MARVEKPWRLGRSVIGSLCSLLPLREKVGLGETRMRGVGASLSG